ncbi:DgyrCDS3281 [Dimorphilus gyrociliatus]|uniref:DgyrCDS3281 n=1 Tax=Dimorphilus gyrociliatus TaxID=2664684 RepID=A0A7I8VEN0_9ANNE|nr:DgyrCDS3281 [Dimorphilus gyrociliatus]
MLGILIIFFLIELSENQVCQDNKKIGNPNLFPKPFVGNGKLAAGARSLVIINEPPWKIDCCGVVKKWLIANEKVDLVRFQIWRESGNADKFQLIGQNTEVVADSPLNADDEYVVDFESKPNQQIPIKPGDVYGWLPDTGPTVYHSNICTHCGSDYYQVPWTAVTNPVVGMQFNASSGLAADGPLDYYIRLLVGPGALPEFTNLRELTIYDNETTGSLLHTLRWKDDNSLETLTLNVTSVPTAKININLTTGEIVVMANLLGSSGVYNYDLSLSDGCNHVQSNLTITVLSSQSTENPTTATTETVSSTDVTRKRTTKATEGATNSKVETTKNPNFLSTTEGKLILGLVIGCAAVLALLLIILIVMACYINNMKISPKR